MQFSQFTMDVTLTSSNTRVDATMMTFSLDSISSACKLHYCTAFVGNTPQLAWKTRSRSHLQVLSKTHSISRSAFGTLFHRNASRPFCFQSSGPLIFLSHDCILNVHEILSNTGWTYMYHIAIRYIICYDSCPEHTQGIHIYLLHLADFYGKCR